MAERIRSFIAIELDPSHHRALEVLQMQLKRERAGRYIRWVASENIHLTLKFLGDVEASKITAVEGAVARACAGVPPFHLVIGGMGTFPNSRRPRVVWVGLAGQIEIAARLAQRLEDSFAALGFSRESRPFSPHLTLGRVKRDVGPADLQFVGQMIENTRVGELGELAVKSVAVMKSDLKPTGSVYARLAAVELSQDQ